MRKQKLNQILIAQSNRELGIKPMTLVSWLFGRFTKPTLKDLAPETKYLAAHMMSARK